LIVLPAAEYDENVGHRGIVAICVGWAALGACKGTHNTDASDASTTTDVSPSDTPAAPDAPDPCMTNVPSGRVVWLRRIGGTPYQQPRSVGAASDHSAYVAGNFGFSSRFSGWI
jgi:hypothetical protein